MAPDTGFKPIAVPPYYGLIHFFALTLLFAIMAIYHFLRGLIMTTIDIGTLKINNKKLETMIKNTNISVEDIKALIIDFLEAELITKEDISAKRKKGKWAKVADEIRGTMSESTSKYLQKCSKEIRSGFELRDLTTS